MDFRRIVLDLTRPSLIGVLLLLATASFAKAPEIPAGYAPLFDGKTLKGWHWSLTNHHGTTGHASIEDRAITLRQHPYGQGGLFVTDKKYKNFDLVVDVKAHYGINSGIFFRSTECGSAYQIEILPAANGTTGDLIGELMRVSLPARATDLDKVWKPDDWNRFRLRVVGDAPHITLWVNGMQMYDVQEPVNDKIAGETRGVIGLQLHWSDVYEPFAGLAGMGTTKPGEADQFRNIAIKELP